MRNYYMNVLKLFFYNRLIIARETLHLTQSQMSELLAMDERSYIELDHGKSCCSAVTLILFLIYCCDEPMQFLLDLKKEFEKGIDHVA